MHSLKKKLEYFSEKLLPENVEFETLKTTQPNCRKWLKIWTKTAKNIDIVNYKFNNLIPMKPNNKVESKKIKYEQIKTAQRKIK